jgi:SAM-dependent methyltransferase
LSQYARFARVYDQDAHRQVAREFHATMVRALGRSFRPQLALDLGCGSGLLTELLAKHVPRVVGLDLSRDMLDLAHDRCRRFGKRVSFLRADLTRRLPAHGAELATASGDIVNHIQALPALGRVFVHARAALAHRGLLVFDSLTQACFECDWDDKVYRMSSPAGDLVMECSWEPRQRTGTARMTSYARVDRGRFERRTTVLKEKFHTDAEIRRLLARAGFGDVARLEWSPWPEQLADHRMDRALWIARAR